MIHPKTGMEAVTPPLTDVYAVPAASNTVLNNADCPSKTTGSQAGEHIGPSVPASVDMVGFTENDFKKIDGVIRERLPVWLADKLAHPPTEGSGVHQWLFIARDLHCHYTEEKIFQILLQATRHCSAGRDIEREIWDAIRNSRKCAYGSGGSVGSYSGGGAGSMLVGEHRPAWIAADLDEVDAIVRSGWSLSKLEDSSPVKWDSDARRAEEIIDVLFPGNPLLCLGKPIPKPDFPGETTYSQRTYPRHAWGQYTSGPKGFEKLPRIHQMPLIVPSPMSKQQGLNKAGRPSWRCEDNTGPRRFLVVEYDFAIKSRDGVTDSDRAPLVRKWLADGISVADACAALLVDLIAREDVPLALAVFSGNKSVQGWIPCLGQTEKRIREFMGVAVRLGADMATRTPCQLIRIPDGTRGRYERLPGARQTVHYFDPEVCDL